MGIEMMIAAQNDNAMYGQGCLPTGVVATNTSGEQRSHRYDSVRRIITVKPRTTIRLLTGMRPMMTPPVVAIPFLPSPQEDGPVVADYGCKAHSRWPEGRKPASGTPGWKQPSVCRSQTVI